jgi:polyisoprenoid-binding protein YceI
MSLIETTLPAGTWNLDPVHSKIIWSVKHSGIATFRGSFAEVDGNLADGVLTGVAKTASVEVPVDQLKGHLLSPDFFDAERNPEITFTSREVSQDGEKLAVKGDLTLRGVTREVEATGSLTGPAVYLDGNERIAIELTTTIDRHDYGIDWNAPLPSGGQALGDAVTISVDLQLVKPSEG